NALRSQNSAARKEPSQQAPKSKLQAPKKRQVPNTKNQAPNSREAPCSKLEARAAVWSLELGISLVFGAWFLVFRFRNISGAWGLVLGVSHAGSSKTEMQSQFPAGILLLIIPSLGGEKKFCKTGGDCYLSAMFRNNDSVEAS